MIGLIVFFRRIKTIGFSDVRILVREQGKSDYLYEEKEIPLELIEANRQMESFEWEIKAIAGGDCSRKTDETGYLEFDKLGRVVNHLTDTIEERNQQLSDHVKELYGLLVQVLEQKDPYTRGHSERVAEYAMGIAEILKCENKEEIHATGLLHDIGKISIEESLLNKAGRFTDEEYEMVKKHAQKGYDLLLECKEFHRISTWVLYHHERLNGSGLFLAIYL
jgi:putative nucleotidyltransferase with HDIG domain